MNTSRIYKTLAALGIALFFAFGAVAVSLAHEVSAATPINAFELRQLLKSGPAQLDAYTLSFGLEYQGANLPISQPDLDEPPPSFSRRIEPLELFFPARIAVPKVSFQILESVLLI